MKCMNFCNVCYEVYTQHIFHVLLGLIHRKNKHLFYEKPWMKRKRLKAQKKYRALERPVRELEMYIKFLQDSKNKD